PTTRRISCLQLLRREKVHAGLVCLNVAHWLMGLDVQKRSFALALDRRGDSKVTLISPGWYPRAEVRYLPESLIAEVPRIVAGLRVGQSFSAIPVPEPPIIRKGASGTFYDKGLEGASHHAVIPNVNAI